MLGTDEQGRAGHLREGLRGLHADAQAREQTGPDPDGEPADLAEVDAGPGEQLLERRASRSPAGPCPRSDPPEDRASRCRPRPRPVGSRCRSRRRSRRPPSKSGGDRVAALGPGGAGRLDRDAPGLVGAGRVAPDELDAEPVFGEQTPRPDRPTRRAGPVRRPRARPAPGRSRPARARAGTGRRARAAHGRSRTRARG